MDLDKEELIKAKEVIYTRIYKFQIDSWRRILHKFIKI